MQTRRGEFLPDRTALLSVHAVSPLLEDAVVGICDRIQDLGLGSCTLLVVPFHNMKVANSLEKHELFCEYLLSLHYELSLNGYSHLSKSGTLDEFRAMSVERMRARLTASISLFEKAFHSRPLGFVPPLWQAPLKLVDLSRASNLQYCVVGDRIFDLRSGNVLSTSACVISSGTKSLDLTHAVLEMEVGGPVQISLHPLDIQSDTVFDVLTDMRDRLGYKFMGYSDQLLH
ncbi:MAG: DUF2334 domain-containing protein [Candidatus Thorarchaeota archaeon]|nr:DUF2334 domain-containing protein [Candidatus Thorarchaeota archaeon]